MWQSAEFSSVTAGGTMSRHDRRFSLFQNVHKDSGAHPDSYALGTGFSSLPHPPGGGARDVKHSIRFSDEIQNEWSYTFTPDIRRNFVKIPLRIPHLREQLL